ncbi:hypothetical protein HNR10_005187 [Nocardiopsis aegyptia]|uniref:DUF742 domain-containing protein n=1 Tax=Nocardiopsis aegyptia TaxID=220378 RepID=A0A7Z0JCJ5_9ACTN|nr:hypothetical protein [Nocardiopsis aegyptia]
MNPWERPGTAWAGAVEAAGGAARERPAPFRRRGGGHPTSEGPAAGVARGDGPSEPLVRPYTLTRGRTRPRSAGPALDMITIVVAAGDREEHHLEPEYKEILRLCHRPISVAEVSARLDMPLTVVKVLLGDLVAEGDVRTRAAVPVTRLPEKKVLQAVLDGIRRL